MTKAVKKPKYILYSVVIAVPLALIIALTIVNAAVGPVLRVAFGGTVTDEALSAESRVEALAVNARLAGEGAVLLKNKDNTLPIATETAVKVNLFGFKAADFVYNASGSAAGDTATAIDLKQGLTDAGFAVNPELYKAIDAYNIERGKSDAGVNEGDTDIANYPLNEMPLGKYTGNISFDKLKAYSEIAIVNVGRLAGEGQDLPRKGYGEDKKSHYLELSAEEKALFAKLKSSGFKVIVLVNSSHAMELGFIEDYDVDAALWIGGPGVNGSTAVGKLLNGEATPSGRLVDTYAYDLTTSSTFFTADTYKYATYDAVKDEYADIGGYSPYSEGIYVGYKWYETADAENFWADVDNEYGRGYEGVVQYPFGYGQSYASFTQAFAAPPTFADGKFTFKVKVTNIDAEYAGKDVVQIYVETPYLGGTEKSKVSLCAFAKTGVLDKGGKTETVELEVKLEDIASYDETAGGNKGAYILDAGEYKFYLSDNAHGWKNADAADTDKFFAYELASKIVFNADNKRKADKTAAENRFAKGMNGNRFSLDNGIGRLCRGGGFANLDVLTPAAATVKLATGEFKGTVVAADGQLYKALVTDSKKWNTVYTGTRTDTTLNGPRKYAFADMYDKAYDDPAWDAFVAQLSLEDMQKLIGQGGWSTVELPSIGKPATVDIDGPFGLSNFIKSSMGVKQRCVSYCSEVVTASTFNVALMEEFGKAVGKEANASGTAGWYAPGANLQRSPFSGRNAEYYAEDPLLSGKACAAVVRGAQSLGLYVYVKHFAYNDQEANRTNAQNCWMTEQTARETYLRPFEIAVKEGDARGLMASYMWTNGTWNGGNKGLMTDVVRGEWGFRGTIVTDNYCAAWMNASKAVMAGTDLMLSNAARKVDAGLAATQAGTKAMKDACFHILYTIASVQNNRLVPITSGTDWWFIIMTVAIAISAVAVLAVGALLTVRIIKYRKYKIAEKNSAETENA